MTSAKILLAFSLIFAGPLAQTSNQYFSKVDKRNEKVFMAKDKASNWIRIYIKSVEKTHPEKNLRMLHAMLDGLENAEFLVRTEIAYDPRDPMNMCDKYPGLISAYVPTNHNLRNEIRICRLGWDYSVNELAQIFVHEAFHLAQHSVGESMERISSESGAILIETNVMRIAVGCSYVYQGYFDDPKYSGRIEGNKVVRLEECKK